MIPVAMQVSKLSTFLQSLAPPIYLGHNSQLWPANKPSLSIYRKALAECCSEQDIAYGICHRQEQARRILPAGNRSSI